MDGWNALAQSYYISNFPHTQASPPWAAVTHQQASDAITNMQHQWNAYGRRLGATPWMAATEPMTRLALRSWSSWMASMPTPPPAADTYATPIASGASFEGAKFTGGEMSRAKAIGTNFRNADLKGTNFYEVDFAGADLRGADFDNAILTNARFGKDRDGKWAELEGVNWDGALLSSSDAQRACENPTVDDYGRAILGCR